MSDEITFEFITDTGFRISQILYSDPDKADWCNNVINKVSQEGNFPPGLVHEITNYLSELGDDESIELGNYISQICQDEDNIDNLLNSIFFPVDEEEDIIEEGGSVPPIVIPEEEEEDSKTINEADLDPESYFENEIKKVMSTYFLSRDIAYALLNKFEWQNNKLQSEWFKNQKKILESLRIVLGSKNVPNLKSPLTFRVINQGECPLCLEDKELYELYCGHHICKECLIDEILQLIYDNKPPVCRQICENGEKCNAEIMKGDVKNLFEGDNENFQKYKKVILSNEILRDSDVKQCPNPHCDWIITPANKLPCHVGRCPQCHAVVCLLCGHKAHAPLINCDKKEEFRKKIATEMRQLEDDQEAWFAREERLKDYRASHIAEVKQVFDRSVNELRQKVENDTKEEKKQIQDLNKIINELNNQISGLRRKLNSYLDLNKPKEDVNRLTSEIEYLNQEISKKTELKSLYDKDLRMKIKEGNADINTAQQEAGFFTAALTSSGQYQYYMVKFRESQDIRAYQNISVTSNDDDYIKKITKKCPKCKTPIQRNEGCNYMQCHRCNFEFCWACEGPWNPTHSNHWQCPKYKIAQDVNQKKKSLCGIDFNDMNDKKFYPQPMSVDKRTEFMRWNNLYTSFRLQKDKYKELYQKFMNFDNEEHDPAKGPFPDFKLSPRNKLIKVLNQEANEKISEMKAVQILNTALFAQSVIMWSYPSLYYMARMPQKARVFEYKISVLEENKDSLLSFINDATNFSCNDILRRTEALEKEIEVILDDAVIF